MADKEAIRTTLNSARLAKRPVKRKRFVAVYSIEYALIDGHRVFTFDAELKKYLP